MPEKHLYENRENLKMYAIVSHYDGFETNSCSLILGSFRQLEMECKIGVRFDLLLAAWDKGYSVNSILSIAGFKGKKNGLIYSKWKI